MIDGDLGETGQTHILRASEIDHLDIEGDTWAEIEVTPGLSNFMGINELTIGGNLYSSIRVDPEYYITAGIGSIEIQGSVVGSVSLPVYMESDFAINEVRILGDADHLVIRPMTPGEAPKVDFITVYGSMTGEVAFPNSLVKEFRVGRDGNAGGDFTGLFDVSENWKVEIGGSLTTNSLININYYSYTKIVFNNNDMGSEWLGDAEYGGTLLGKPQYIQTQSSLNGSAFGQVPFLIHGVDSTLTFDGSTPISESIIDEVVWKAYTGGAPEGLWAQVRFFGQVQPPGGWPGGSGGIGGGGIAPAPFVFERRPIGEVQWRDISDCYGAEMYSAPGGGAYSVVLAGANYLDEMGPVGYRNGYEYRLRPTDDLFCILDRLDPDAPDVPVGDDAMTWRVGNLCPADLNADGVVNADDLGLLLSNFGSSDLINGNCGELIGDTNGDNIVDADDLGVLLSTFGNDECGASMSSSMSSMAGGTVSSAELLASLGFETAEAFASFVAGLEPAQQIEAITAAWVLAQSLEQAAQESAQ